MIGIVTQEAVERFGKTRVYEFDTTRTKPEKTADEILETIKGRSRRGSHMIGRRDWLSK